MKEKYFAVQVTAQELQKDGGESHEFIFGFTAVDDNHALDVAKVLWQRNFSNSDLSFVSVISLDNLDKMTTLKFLSNLLFHQNEWSEAGMYRALQSVIKSVKEQYSIDELQAIVIKAVNY